MVILSAALKGIPAEMLEAARVDGAGEWRVFWRIILPMLGSTIAVVATTMVVTVVKTFDIVYVMTNGNFNTEVIANRWYKEMFNFREFGRASAIAVVLMLAIVPIMLVQPAAFRSQEARRCHGHSRGPQPPAATTRRPSIGYELRRLPLHLAVSLICAWSGSFRRSGLLVSSFRPPNLVATQPAGGRRSYRRSSSPSQNYERVLTANNLATELRQQPVHLDPGDGDSDHGGGVRGLRVRLDGAFPAASGCSWRWWRCWSCRCR